jgi:hypothetical protein
MQHTRRGHLRQVAGQWTASRSRGQLAGRLWRFLFALAGILICVAPIGAQSQGTSVASSAVTIVPAPSSPAGSTPAGSKADSRGVELRVQTVDALIVQDAAAVWADTQVWIRLLNPATQTVTITLSLSAAHLARADLPPDLQATLDEKPLPTHPATADPNQDWPGLTAEHVLAPRGTASLRLSYRQALSETAGLTQFAYPLSAAGRWAGAPESLRVTLKFAAPLAREQILGHSPPIQKQTDTALTWEWEGQPASRDVWLAFMTPRWWADFAAARSAATAAGAGPAEHLALGERYAHLAGLPALPAQGGADFFARYYPPAVAELQAALAAGARRPATAGQTVAAHLLLASLYRRQADRLGRAGESFWQLVAAEGQAALAQGAAAADVRDLLSEAYTRLTELAQASGDAAGAAEYRGRLAALQAVSPSAADSQTARLAQASQAMARRDFDAARQIIAETFGADAAVFPGGRPPLAHQALLIVTTEPHARVLSLMLADNGQPAAVEALLRQAAGAAASVPGAQALAAADRLTITLLMEGGLAEAQARLAAALPTAPELALLSAGLTQDKTAWQNEDRVVQVIWRYVEQVDLRPAAAAWQQLVDRLTAVSLRLPAPDAPVQTVEERLGQIQRGLWSADASAWRSLAAESRVTYRVTWRDPDVTREWQVPIGAARVLAAEATRWLPERLKWLALGGAAFLLLLALLVWRR